MDTIKKVLVVIAVFILTFLALIGGMYFIIPLIIAILVWYYMSETKK